MSDGIKWYRENVEPYIKLLNGYGFTEYGEIICTSKRDTGFNTDTKYACPIRDRHSNMGSLFKTKKEAKLAAVKYFKDEKKEKQNEIKDIDKILKKIKVYNVSE